MTFSVTRDHGLFEWAGDNLLTVFVQPKNLLNPRMWRMLVDVMRFNLFGLDLVQEDEGSQGKGTKRSKREDEREAEEDLSIGEYLDKEGFGEGFKEDYLLVSFGSANRVGGLERGGGLMERRVCVCYG
jgi:predicted NAD/FAD-binding protein